MSKYLEFWQKSLSCLKKIMDFFPRILELWAKIPSFGWKNPWKWTFYYFIKILNVMSNKKFPVNWVFDYFLEFFGSFLLEFWFCLSFFRLSFFFQMRNDKPALDSWVMLTCTMCLFFYTSLTAHVNQHHWPPTMIPIPNHY